MFIGDVKEEKWKKTLTKTWFFHMKQNVEI
jgi:hypothetical protein